MILLKTISFIAIASAFSFNVNATTSAEDFIQDSNPVVLKTASLMGAVDLHQGRGIRSALSVSSGVSKVILRCNPADGWKGDSAAEWRQIPQFLRDITAALLSRPAGSLSTVTEFRLDSYFWGSSEPKAESDETYQNLLRAFKHTSPHLKTFVWVRNVGGGSGRFWAEDYEVLTRAIFPNLEMTDFKVLTRTGKLKNNFKWVSNSDGTRGIAHNQDYFDSSSRLTW